MKIKITKSNAPDFKVGSVLNVDRIDGVDYLEDGFFTLEWMVNDGLEYEVVDEEINLVDGDKIPFAAKRYL